MKKRKTKRHSVLSKSRKVKLSRAHTNRTKKKQIKRAIKSSRSLKKRILFHPVTVLVLLCIGVLIIGWTYKVVADYYTITAVVEAVPLTQGATITEPTDGYVSTTQLITVEGTCPYGSYVDLYDNSVFNGVAWCLSDGTYSIQMDLYLGQNILMVQDYNVTNVPGPTTPTIAVTYQPISQPTNIPTTTTTTSNGKKEVIKTYNPMLLQSTFHFQTFLERQTFSWKVTLSGGRAPFIINVTWGDDQTTAFTLSADGPFNISHVYDKGGYYPILVEAIDSTGSQKVLQLAALIRYPGQSSYTFPPSGSIKPSNTNGSGFSIGKLFSGNEWLLIAWPFYIVILLMATSFWLGERQEYYRLVKSRRT